MCKFVLYKGSKIDRERLSKVIDTQVQILINDQPEPELASFDSNSDILHSENTEPHKYCFDVYG